MPKRLNFLRKLVVVAFCAIKIYTRRKNYVGSPIRRVLFYICQAHHKIACYSRHFQQLSKHPATQLRHKHTSHAFTIFIIIRAKHIRLFGKIKRGSKITKV